MATEQPTTESKQLAEFVMKAYTRLWLSIKTKSSCKYGGLHLWEMIHWSKYLVGSTKKIIYPVIERNAYFAHSENLLLCMLVDERTHVRELALRRVLKAQREKPRFFVRRFRVPSLNFNSTDYIDLVHWQNCEVTVPLILSDMSEDQLKSLIDDHASQVLEFKSFPSLTQSIERTRC